MTPALRRCPRTCMLESEPSISSLEAEIMRPDGMEKSRIARVCKWQRLYECGARALDHGYLHDPCNFTSSAMTAELVQCGTRKTARLFCISARRRILKYIESVSHRTVLLHELNARVLRLTSLEPRVCRRQGGCDTNAAPSRAQDAGTKDIRRKDRIEADRWERELNRTDRNPCRRLTLPSLLVGTCQYMARGFRGELNIPSSFSSSFVSSAAAAPPVAAPPAAGAAAAPPPEPTFSSRSLTSLPSRA